MSRILLSKILSGFVHGTTPTESDPQYTDSTGRAGTLTFQLNLSNITCASSDTCTVTVFHSNDGVYWVARGTLTIAVTSTDRVLWHIAEASGSTAYAGMVKVQVAFGIATSSATVEVSVCGRDN